MSVDLLGWASSIVLLATIASQVHKQWRARSAEGVSRWLFVGQTAASAGFTAYSALVKNWVFTVTNALLLVSAIVGWVLTRHFRKRGSKAGAAPAPAARSEARNHDAKIETV